MKELRLGIIGLGNMGSAHAASVMAGKIPRCRLAGVCDTDAEKIAKYPGFYASTDSDTLIASGEVDAVLVATPHYSHTTIGTAALKAGLHVLVEKPISVHKADCERLILLNQCPHNLDLYQWIFGMPSKVRGFCKLGYHHKIEVEDDVTAYFEYKDGTSAVFITSTGEAPGANRLEISAERGRLVMEGGKLSFTRNEIPMTEFSRTTTESFSRPPVWNVEIPVVQTGEQHNGILKNFTNAILDGEKLLSPAAEGIHSVELGNAILMSSMLGETVEVPFASARYEKLLNNLIATSRFKKKAVKKNAAGEDFSKSFLKTN